MTFTQNGAKFTRFKINGFYCDFAFDVRHSEKDIARVSVFSHDAPSFMLRKTRDANGERVTVMACDFLAMLYGFNSVEALDAGLEKAGVYAAADKAIRSTQLYLPGR